MESNKAIDSALVEAMKTWPTIEGEHGPEKFPPILPKISTSDLHFSAYHTTSFFSCHTRMQTLFALGVEKAKDVGNAHSTRSKSKQPVQLISQQHLGRAKRSKTTQILPMAIPVATDET